MRLSRSVLSFLLLLSLCGAAAAAETYRVKKGDTLSSISRRYGVTVQQLQEWNNLKGSRIYAGQHLKVSSPQKTETKRTEKNDYIIYQDYYVVKKGDNLSLIARRFGTTVAALKKQNRLKSNTIQPGQRLLVRTRQVRKKVSVPAFEPKPIIEADITFHTVKEGESLESIAAQYSLSEEEIREANLMPEKAEVKTGQVLAIPQKEQR